MARGGKREGAGRKAGVTIPTRVKRIPTDISDEAIDNIPALRDLIAHWEDECVANPENPRHYFLKQMIDEIRELGY